jgi:hypothetical protein
LYVYDFVSESFFGGKSRHVKYFILKPSGLISWGDSAESQKYQERIVSIQTSKDITAGDNSILNDLKLSPKESNLFFMFKTTGKDLLLVADNTAQFLEWIKYSEHVLEKIRNAKKD